MKVIIGMQNQFLRIDEVWTEGVERALDVEPPEGLQVPVWNGEGWEEGLPEDELSANLQPDEHPLVETMVSMNAEILELKAMIAQLLAGGSSGG